MELAEEKSMRKQGIWGMSVLVLSLSILSGLQAQSTQRPKGDLPGPIDNLKDLEDTGRMLFMMADENHDGQISQQESMDAADLIVGGFFFRADGNGDGVVSPEEWQRARENFLQSRPWLRYVVETARATPQPGQAGQPGSAQQNPIRVLQTIFDTNNDRQLSAAELKQGVHTIVQSLFTTADTNRDNQLSPTEVNAAMAGVVKSAVQASFQAADADHSGALTLQEWDRSLQGPAHVVFNILDGNHDGQLTPTELQQAERVLVSQIRSIRIPNAPNSPSNLIRTGRLPSEVAPVPALGTPNQPVQPVGSTPARPAPR